MQFTKLAALLGLAAFASAAAINPRNGGTVCKEKSGKCKPEDPSKCKSEGGEPFSCKTIGLINALDCISLLDGNSVSVPITIPISL